MVDCWPHRYGDSDSASGGPVLNLKRKKATGAADSDDRAKMR
jgi:hypothetical protein